MISVSDAWKKLHQELLLPETFVEIRLDMSDPGVVDLVTVSSDNEADFSNSKKVVKEQGLQASYPKYAFLEHNLWSLDGTIGIMEDVESYDPPGFVSDDDSPTSLVLSLSEVRNVSRPGFEITWGSEFGEYATNFTVEIRRGSSVIASATVTDNKSSLTQLELSYENYDSVTITVHEWSHPNHRVRIDDIVFGNRLIFDKGQLLAYTHEQLGDPFSGELPTNRIEFSVDNSDGRWDLMNPNGFERYLYERQPITVRYGMNVNGAIEWMQAGRFYLTEWRTPSNGLEATFVARDIFELLLSSNYERKSRKGTVVNPGATHSSITSTGVLVFPTAAAVDGATEEAVATVPFGTAVNVYERCATYSSDVIEDPTRYEFVSARIDQGWVLDSCVTINSDEDVSALRDLREAIKAGDIEVQWEYGPRFESGVMPLGINELSVAELIQLACNKCAYAMWQAADGVLRFKTPERTLSDYVIPKNLAYTNPEIELSKPLKQVDVVGHYPYTELTTNITLSTGVVGEIITVDNPFVMVGESHTDILAQEQMNWWMNRGFVSGEYRADPRLEVFDVVTVESKYGDISPVMITEITYSYTGAFHGTYKGKILSPEFLNA